MHFIWLYHNKIRDRKVNTINELVYPEGSASEYKMCNDIYFKMDVDLACGSPKGSL